MTFADRLVQDDTLRADFGWALGVLYRAYLRSADQVLDELPGGPRGYQVLAAATREHPASQRQIAQETGVDRTVMTYLIDQLERAGLVERRPDPADRRNRRVVATEDGRARLGELDARLVQVREHVLGELDTDQRQQLHCLLQRAAIRLDALDPADSCTLAAEIRQKEQG